MRVPGPCFSSYVAIGDSLSEGLGDFTFGIERLHNGWTDRLAGILAHCAGQRGVDFKYANLAIRGAKLDSIVGGQLDRALHLKPNLVSVMAGSNDLMAPVGTFPALQDSLRMGVERLLESGSEVLIANTINPLHLRVFRPLRYRAEQFSELINEVASALDVPLLDVFRMSEFSELIYWAPDMVHFSGHGHIRIANEASGILGLSYRYPELEPEEVVPLRRGPIVTAEWVVRDVIPFIGRKLKGVTSGDGMSPKQEHLASFNPKREHPHWQLISA